MENNRLILKMRLDKPPGRTDNVDVIRTLTIVLPSDYSNIDIHSESQKAVLNAICQGFGFLFGCFGGSLVAASIDDGTTIPPEDDDCEMCRFSGLISEDL